MFQFIPDVLDGGEVLCYLCLVTPVFLSQSVSHLLLETARTRGNTEGSCHPGKEAPRRRPQRLVFPRQAPGGGAGALGLRDQRTSRQPLQTEHPGQGQVSRGNTCICFPMGFRRWCSIILLSDRNV